VWAILVWTDPAASPSSLLQLVNDLNLLAVSSTIFVRAFHEAEEILYGKIRFCVGTYTALSNYLLRLSRLPSSKSTLPSLFSSRAIYLTHSRRPSEMRLWR